MIVSNEKIPNNQRQLLVNIVSGKCRYTEQCSKIYCDRVGFGGFVTNTIEKARNPAAFRLLIDKNIIQKVGRNLAITAHEIDLDAVTTIQNLNRKGNVQNVSIYTDADKVNVMNKLTGKISQYKINEFTENYIVICNI
jgi:hypothetical protein